MTTSSNDTTKANLVIVLGMHRSGTSALTGLLHRLGFRLGDRLLEASTANEKGYFESVDILLKNEVIFSLLNSSWYEPLPLPDEWWTRPELESIKRDIAELLEQQFSGNRLWAIKDPRMCRLLPLWLDILAGMDVNVSFVLMLRQPEEVASSLNKRDHFTLNHSTALWLSYVLDAERYSRGYPRTIMTFDGLMADWRKAVADIEGLIPGETFRLDASVEEIEAFLTPSLRHHQASTSSMSSLLLPAAVAVYDTLASGGGDACLALDRYYDEFAELAALFCVDESAMADDEAQQQWRYEKWRSRHAVLPGDAQLMAERMQNTWLCQPTMHIILLAMADEQQLLADSLDSLETQFYQNWGLTVIAPFEAVSPVFAEAPNLQWICAQQPESEVAGVIADSGADWLGVLSAGDTLERTTLFRFADYINIRPGWMLIYSDHDCLSDEGGYHDPSFKPDINMELLRSQPYIGRFVLAKRDLLTTGELGAQPFGLTAYAWTLAALESLAPSAIGHISDILFHQSDRASAKQDNALVQQQLISIVRKHLKLCGVDAEVTSGAHSNSTTVSYSLTHSPLLSVVIAHCDQLEYLHRCIYSIIDNNNYENYEIVIADMGSEHDSCRQYYSRLKQQLGERFSLIRSEGETLPAVYNLASRQAKGDYFLFLDLRVQHVEPSSLGCLMAIAIQPDVAIVSPRLTSARDSSVVYAGIVLGVDGAYSYPFVGQPPGVPGYQGRALLQQEHSAASAVCMLVEGALFNELGGFDSDNFSLVGFDVDYSLRALQHGRRIIWTPYTTLVYSGEAIDEMPGELASGERQRWLDDTDALVERWLPVLANDPAYNRHLSLNDRRFAIDVEYAGRWDCYFHSRPRVLGLPLSSRLDDLRLGGPLKRLDEQALIQYQGLTPIESHKPESVRAMTPVELERLKPDVFILQGALSDKQLAEVERYRRFNDCRIIFDLDAPEIGTDKRCGGMQMDMGNSLRRVLSCADRLWASTSALADLYRDAVPDIRKVPNYLASSQWGGLQSRRRVATKPRVGWAGSSRNHGDLEYIVEVVKATASEVEWVFMGMCLDELRPYVSEVHGFAEHGAFPQKLAALNLDLAIAPLEAHPDNAARSHLILLEYGILGWPVVCSDSYPYPDAPVTRVNNDVSSWLSAIRKRIHNPDATAAEGDKLRQWVLDNYMLEGHLDVHYQALMP